MRLVKLENAAGENRKFHVVTGHFRLKLGVKGRKKLTAFEETVL